MYMYMYTHTRHDLRRISMSWGGRLRMSMEWIVCLSVWIFINYPCPPRGATKVFLIWYFLLESLFALIYIFLIFFFLSYLSLFLCFLTCQHIREGIVFLEGADDQRHHVAESWRHRRVCVREHGRPRFREYMYIYTHICIYREYMYIYTHICIYTHTYVQHGSFLLQKTAVTHRREACAVPTERTHSIILLHTEERPGLYPARHSDNRMCSLYVTCILLPVLYPARHSRHCEQLSRVKKKGRLIGNKVPVSTEKRPCAVPCTSLGTAL